MKWKCLRCEKIFDDSNKQCDCVESPSPWIPHVEIQFETIEIKAGPRRLSDQWTFEVDPVVVCMYAAPETKWSRFCHWVKYLFVKGKIKKL